MIRSCTAPAHLVYALLEDVAGWPNRMPGVSAASWETRGTVTATGAGAIRAMRAAGLTTREQVIAADPPHTQTYAMLSGLPVRDYVGEVRIGAREGGSSLTWGASFIPRFPGTGRVIRFAMSMAIGHTASALAREADRLHETSR